VSKSIPISAAREFAKNYEKDQVIVLSFSRSDGKTWVTTYGKTAEDCEQAALGGNKLKQVMGWPEELCNAKPSRQVAREKEITRLKEEVASLKKELEKAKRVQSGLAEVALSYRDDLVSIKGPDL